MKDNFSSIMIFKFPDYITHKNLKATTTQAFILNIIKLAELYSKMQYK
jgi:capsule polysaccharide modification protein KpsS